MPIIGLTNRPASFPEIGRLRKGDKKTDPKKPGADLKYFRFDALADDEMGQQLAAAFLATYGPEPAMIHVHLPFRTADGNWEAWQEEYVAGGLVHRCDGQTMTLWQKPGGAYSTEPKPCPYFTGDKQRTDKIPGCKPTGRLKVIIPELVTVTFGYVTIGTGSNHDIRNLDAQLRALEDESLRVREAKGLVGPDLRNALFQLLRRPYKISTPGQDGKRVRREKWLLSIATIPRLATEYLLAAEQAAAPLMLKPGGITVDNDTGEILNTPPDEWEDGVEEDDIEEGDFTEEEGEMWAEAQGVKPKQEPPAPTNGDAKPAEPPAAPMPARPSPAEKVRKAIRKNGGWIDIDTRRTDTEAVTPAQVTALLATMTQAVKPSQGVLSSNETDGRRHAVLEYLLGVTSTGSLTKAEASALLDWLTDPSDIKSLNEYAGRECAIVYAAWQVEQGRGELPL